MLDEWIFCMFTIFPSELYFNAMDCPYMFYTLHLQDVCNLTTFMTNTTRLAPEDKKLSISGRNWGEVDLDGLSLFLSFWL